MLSSQNTSVVTVCSERAAAQSAYRAGRLREAADICRQGIERACAQGEREESWLLRILLSQCLCYQGDFSGAVAILERPPRNDAVSVSNRARILRQKGFALSMAGQFADAKMALDQALDLAATEPPSLRAEVELVRVTLFFYLAKYDEVERCARIALEIGEQQGMPLIEASACAGMGKSAMYTARHAEAIPWFERAMAIYDREGVTAYADMMRSEIGCCHFALGQDEQASGYFVHCLKASRNSSA
jgi:tetratricopeptide (TPR) repeat protein